MTRSLFVIICVVALNAIGVGLIFPILPDLLRSLTGSAEISTTYGLILAAYAAMQFLLSPILGLLSDRYGRRPVLLVSLAGSAIDYLVMAFAPNLWVLVIGRLIAGATSANMAVASAYIADITEEKDRAQRFSWMSAAFGIGFIVGPALGGLMSTWFLHAPFLAAAVLNGLNLVLAYFMLKESRVPSREKLEASALNPFGPLRWAFSFPALAPLLAMFLIFAINGDIPGTIWVLYGAEKFSWDGVTVGLSLTVFGVVSTLAQAFITGPLTKWLGERRTMAVGVTADAVAFLLIGLATEWWMPFALSPLFALGGVGLPALQSMMSAEVSEDRQGELQGVLASAMSLTSIIGPLLATGVYFWTKPFFIGAVWILAAALYLLAIPVLGWVGRQRRVQPA
jgi:DHA1 family tetracycline resistance protein-like MFS transporter